MKKQTKLLLAALVSAFAGFTAIIVATGVSVFNSFYEAYYVSPSIFFISSVSLGLFSFRGVKNAFVVTWKRITFKIVTGLIILISIFGFFLTWFIWLIATSGI